MDVILASTGYAGSPEQMWDGILGILKRQRRVKLQGKQEFAHKLLESGVPKVNRS